MSAEPYLKARWTLCPGHPGVILADLGASGAPDIVVIDGWHELSLSDEAATAIAQHIVDMHNADLARAANRKACPDAQPSTFVESMIGRGMACVVQSDILCDRGHRDLGERVAMAGRTLVDVAQDYSERKLAGA